MMIPIKRVLIFFLLFVSAEKSFSQLLNPIKWNFTAKKVADKKFEIRMSATLSPGWHVYAQNAGDGPVSTSIAFNPNPLLKFDGKIQEKGKLETNYDPNFKSTLRYYSNSVDFVTTVTSKSKANTVINGTVKYMVCNEQKCLPPKEIPFKVSLTNK